MFFSYTHELNFYILICDRRSALYKLYFQDPALIKYNNFQLAKEVYIMLFSSLEQEILETATMLFVGTTYIYHSSVLKSEFLQAVNKLIHLNILYEDQIDMENGCKIEVYKRTPRQIEDSIL